MAPSAPSSRPRHGPPLRHPGRSISLPRHPGRSGAESRDPGPRGGEQHIPAFSPDPSTRDLRPLLRMRPPIYTDTGLILSSTPSVRIEGSGRRPVFGSRDQSSSPAFLRGLLSAGAQVRRKASSCGSGFSGSTTLSVTSRSPWPLAAWMPLPFSRRQVPVFEPRRNAHRQPAVRRGHGHLGALYRLVHGHRQVEAQGMAGALAAEGGMRRDGDLDQRVARRTAVGAGLPLALEADRLCRPRSPPEWRRRACGRWPRSAGTLSPRATCSRVTVRL